MAEFNFPPNDPDTLDPLDFTVDPWTDPNGTDWLYVASPGYWAVVPASSGGASAWADLTDKVTAPLPTDNTALAAALAGKLSTTTAASTYAPISTTVTLSGTQTLSNKTFDEAGFSMIESLFFNTVTVTATPTTLVVNGVTQLPSNGDGQYLTNISAAQITYGTFGAANGSALTSLNGAELTGNIAVARIANALTAPGAIGGTTPSTGAFTTVTIGTSAQVGTKLFLFSDKIGVAQVINTYASGSVNLGIWANNKIGLNRNAGDAFCSYNTGTGTSELDCVFGGAYSQSSSEEIGRAHV
jgi:hypothetical protein